MSNWFDKITTDVTTRTVELAAQFAERRHQVLSENIANIDTPDYQARHLDAGAFSATLRDALRCAKRDGTEALELRDNAQVSTGPAGELIANPTIEPVENALFHDGTNANLDKLMTDASENSLQYEVATTLLRGRFDTLLRAVRGRVG